MKNRKHKWSGIERKKERRTRDHALHNGLKQKADLTTKMKRTINIISDPHHVDFYCQLYKTKT